MILVIKESGLRSVWHPWDLDLINGLVSPDKDVVSDFCPP